MYQEINFDVQLPSVGDAYAIKVHVEGMEPLDDDLTQFLLSSIQWRTYCDELNEDVNHYIYSVWMNGHEMVDMLGQVVKLIGKLSS